MGEQLPTVVDRLSGFISLLVLRVSVLGVILPVVRYSEARGSVFGAIDRLFFYVKAFVGYR